MHVTTAAKPDDDARRSDREGSGYREHNSTADRALTILGLFSDDHLTVSAIEVADALGCARSTAYRYLQTLVGARFLEDVPGGGFRLGIRVMELSRLARRGFGLPEVAMPAMQRLARELGETVLLTKRVGESVICVERCEGSSQLIRLSYERGSRLPINAGASALVLLAWLPETEARDVLTRFPLQSFTSNTITDVDELMLRLSDIRERGVAVTLGEVDPDAVGVAAPILDESGAAAAGLSVVAMRRNVPPERLQHLITAVRDEAARLTPHLAVVTA